MNRPYDSVLWRKLRRVILDRDGQLCQLQRRGCKRRADAVHHVKDWRSGGAWFDPDNLVASCTPCNTSEANTRKAAAIRPAPLAGVPPSRDWLSGVGQDLRR